MLPACPARRREDKWIRSPSLLIPCIGLMQRLAGPQGQLADLAFVHENSFRTTLAVKYKKHPLRLPKLHTDALAPSFGASTGLYSFCLVQGRYGHPALS